MKVTGIGFCTIWISIALIFFTFGPIAIKDKSEPCAFNGSEVIINCTQFFHKVNIGLYSCNNYTNTTDVVMFCKHNKQHLVSDVAFQKEGRWNCKQIQKMEYKCNKNQVTLDLQCQMVESNCSQFRHLTMSDRIINTFMVSTALSFFSACLFDSMMDQDDYWG